MFHFSLVSFSPGELCVRWSGLWRGQRKMSLDKQEDRKGRRGLHPGSASETVLKNLGNE